MQLGGSTAARSNAHTQDVLNPRNHEKIVRMCTPTMSLAVLKNPPNPHYVYFWLSPRLAVSSS
eukprot:scaffold37963_cov13-Tisochrysis_lutea.AAC.1